ncbi:uncharacterized protein si:ch211-91p5.3 isoform X2 [Pimephales promelas]|uniref:uncharacterized protein si:ch211-91p5.3 isoform X2 n=1 Tax=Pimephales promelas TaxID=90988 RepID=UPI0019554FF8|nr:uncharacterized protein si:ch211-91p5.3 isoform X2 [Pimephales promelas]
MSSSQSYTRFGDDNYKNWLKTTESLSILRNCIKDFVEKETETYHNSLRNKPELNGQTCKNTCAFKKEPPLCELCKCWKKEIEAKYIGGKNNMHWENCRPHLWSTEKWEVAKAYMPRGHTKHNQFSQFDVSAILNLMSSCKHFNNIPGHCVRNVINVRNSAMHSPDLKMSKEEMIRHHETVLQLAKKLEHLIPRLKGLEKEMKQFNNILDRNFNEAPCEVDGQQVDKQTMEILDREQQALKDRIEDFISRFEGNLDGNVEEKPQDMKSLLDFLDQNKDLLVNLGPEVDKLKDMQAKVDQHEKEIHNLANRVENLEKGTHDPVLPVIPPKFKNHLYEYCQAKKWPGDKYPVFSELREAQGYRAEVKVNGQTFIGTKVYTDKKAAHQEVAYIALEQLKLQDESTDESSSSVTQPEASCSTSSGINFFGKVTVDLDQEVASDRCSSKEEATEAAYKDLWERFHISAPAEGRTYRSLIMEYFHTQCFQNPTENFVQNDDDTTICKLKLIGRFTFYDKDGSTKKKQAEQQAAKVALQHLSGILNGAPISDTEKNFKVELKERLDKLGLKSPVYDTEKKTEISDEHVTSGISSGLATSAVSISQATEKDHSELKSKSISTTAQLPEPVPVPVLLDPQESSSPATQKKKPKIDCPGITFFSKVTVDLDQEVKSDRCSSKEEATEAAYKFLWEKFCISAPAEGQTYRSVIMDHFDTNDLQKPTEEFVDDDNYAICILKFKGPFTFYDKDGSTNKKQAEHQAAKVALQNLSGILNGAPISDTEKNFKGKLKECLDKLGLKNPVYETKEYKKDISEELVTSGVSPHLSNLSISQAAENDLSESKSISTTAQLPSGQEPVRVPVPALPDPQESSSPQRKKPRIDCPEINELFNVYNLKPPHVKLENITCNENFKCNVEINLEKFTFVNKQDYDSKKEATRKTYLLFGRAVSIFDSSSDEKTSSAKVKEVFSQNSLPLPQEDFEGSGKPFYCSLKNINYKVIYTGQGSSEGEAKLIAFQNALRSLAPLFGYDSLTGAESAEAVQNQLSSMLKGAGQKDPVIYLKPMEQANIQLSFCDYMLKCSCQSSKKAARNHLSARILGLLGVKTVLNLLQKQTMYL